MMSNPFANWKPEDVVRFNSRNSKEPRATAAGVPLEVPLHNRIIEFCNSQWPRWKFIHANPSARSTIQLGCQDFTIFMPGRVLCIECKARDGKLSEDQQVWAAEMRRLGHEVHVVRSFEEFLRLSSKFQNPSSSLNTEKTTT